MDEIQLFEDGVAKARAYWSQIYGDPVDDGSELSYLVMVSDSDDDDVAKAGDDVEKEECDVDKVLTSTIEHVKAPSDELMSVESKSVEPETEMSAKSKAVAPDKELSVKLKTAEEEKTSQAVLALLELSTDSSGSADVALTTSPTNDTGVWELYINKSWVKEIVASIPPFSVQGKATMMAKILKEHEELYSKYQSKLCGLEQLFKKMAATKVQDIRILNRTSNIIEVIWMSCDVSPAEYHFFSAERAFAVHDPLAFNLMIREFQATDPLFRGVTSTTKPVSDVLHAIGLGPPKGTIAWNAKYFRGPPDTDPALISPATGEKQVISMRDLLYYKGYVTIPGKAKQMAKRHTRNDRKRARPVEVATADI
jgi:hypothetical protein